MKLQVTAYTPVGIFVGFTRLNESKDAADLLSADGKELINTLAENINLLVDLVLVTDDGKVIAINKKVLEQSVLSFVMVD